MEERNFKDLLEYHIRESGYTNYEFARMVGINRVNIQRYLAGTRLPNPQTFEMILKELRLGSREQTEFYETYRRAYDGDDIYFLRKSIRSMLEQAGDICGTERRMEHNTEDRREMHCEDIGIISGKIAVERYLWSTIGGILQKTESSFAYLYIPAERFVLARFLPTYQEKSGSVLERLKIIQIVQLTKRLDLLRHQYHNLKVISNLIPTYYQAGVGYETCFYYHDYTAAEMNDGLLYPYYVILENQVVHLSSDMEQAIVVPDKNIVNLYKEKFLQKCRGGGIAPLVRYFGNAAEMLEWLLQNDRGAESRCFLEYQPCVAAWVDRELLDRVLKPELPDREAFIEAICVRVKQLEEPGERVNYFTEAGLREFVENGICTDYPPEYVRPFTRKERMVILDRMISSMENWDGDFGIIDDACLRLTGMLNIFVSSACGTSLVLYDEKQGFRHILVKEPSICQAFETYMKGMREHKEVYSREKTLEILKQYRGQMREE